MSFRLHGRSFRPRPWAAVLTLGFVAITVSLGNWQGERARYKLTQQQELDQALAARPLALPLGDSVSDPGLRYRRVEGQAQLLKRPVWLLDNRIYQGKAGYAVLQLLEVDSPQGEPETYLVDRGWVEAPADRSILPEIASPEGRIEVRGRLNLPPSRHPGSADNTGGVILNYIDWTELERASGRPLKRYMIEIMGGPAWLGTERAAPAARIDHHYGYQLQWYAMALLAVVTFLVLSFRRTESA